MPTHALPPRTLVRRLPYVLLLSLPQLLILLLLPAGTLRAGGGEPAVVTHARHGTATMGQPALRNERRAASNEQQALPNEQQAASNGQEALSNEPQATSDGQEAAWNDQEALDLVARARRVRQDLEADTALGAYQALATGHLYFLLDRGGTGERTLVRADQLAVDVFWQHPDRVRQEIVGRRSEERLPTTIRYHLDHLAVVTDDFDDLINMGHGDEVRAALHPLAPGSETVYDFRTGDSLSISLPDGRTVRVVELRVRAKDPDRPGVVGSVFVDRDSGAVVRMGLTFTPASYVDPTLDYIRIRLDHSLWEGRFWLPYRQEIEIRRELPYLDTPAGTVIRARYEIGGYTFGNEMPPAFFQGPEVRQRPSGELDDYPFREDLYAALEREGLRPTPDLQQVRRTALQVMTRDRLSGLGRLRLFAPSASSVVRHGRAEGTYVGAGASFRPSERLTLRLDGGYAFGRGEPAVSAELTGGSALPRTGARAFLNELRDVGPVPGASGTMSTLASLLLERSWRDPWFSSGAHLFHEWGSEDGARIGLRGRYEEHEAASLVLDDPEAGRYRPVPAVDEGTLQAVDLDVDLLPDDGSTGAGGWSLGAGLTGGRFEGESFGEGRARIGWSRQWVARDVELDARLRLGALTAAAPEQSLYRLGGRQSLPGYGYRGFGGDRFALLRTSLAWGVGAPWIRPRIFGAAGWTGYARDRGQPPDDPDPTRAARQGAAPSAPAPSETGIPLFSAGVGAGLFWDVLRVEAGYGLNGGGWEWTLSVNRTFWPWL